MNIIKKIFSFRKEKLVSVEFLNTKSKFKIGEKVYFIYENKILNGKIQCIEFKGIINKLNHGKENINFRYKISYFLNFFKDITLDENSIFNNPKECFESIYKGN